MSGRLVTQPETGQSGVNERVEREPGTWFRELMERAECEPELERWDGYERPERGQGKETLWGMSSETRCGYERPERGQVKVIELWGKSPDTRWEYEPETTSESDTMSENEKSLRRGQYGQRASLKDGSQNEKSLRRGQYGQRASTGLPRRTWGDVSDTNVDENESEAESEDMNVDNESVIMEETENVRTIAKEVESIGIGDAECARFKIGGSDVPGETSTGSIGILISEVKYVEHQKAMKAMGDVDSGSNVINVMSVNHGIELRWAEEDREESSRIEGSGG